MAIFNSSRLIGALALTTSLVAPQAAQAATGLAGAWYDVNVSITNLAHAETLIAGKTPDATFTSTTVCYPACHTTMSDNNSLNSFLGGNATDISANSINNIGGHIMTLTGFINIATSGNHLFTLRSDDGSGVWIGDWSILSDGNHSLSNVNQSHYFDAGAYAIRIVQFENTGHTGLTFKMDHVPVSGPTLTPPVLPAVPEPATWAMMIGGFGLAGGAMRRRANKVAFAAA